MDWSKAKTIVIVALLVTDLLLGAFFVFGHMQEVSVEKQAAQSAGEYLAERGVQLNCEIPAAVVRLPVLFVDFSEDGGKDLRYRGYPVEMIGGGSYVPVSLQAGETKGRVCGAASALIKASLQHPELTRVDGLCLVYRIDRGGYDGAGEDTAFPAWKITTDAGCFYVDALN